MTKRLSFLFTVLCAINIVGCTSTIDNPIGSRLASDYSVGEVVVVLENGRKIPDRYDESVHELIDNAEDQIAFSEFLSYAEQQTSYREDDTDPIAESYFTWLVDQKVSEALGTRMTGEAPANLSIEVGTMVWPNAALMLFSGEVVSSDFSFEATDDEGKVLVNSNKFLTALSDERTGVYPLGVIGMAARSSEGQHITDLNRMADAITEIVVEMLASPTGTDLFLNRLDASGLDGSE
ncbi:MAG: hypothetical protein AAFO57_09970 [Pseudomonadota bacterium]